MVAPASGPQHVGEAVAVLGAAGGFLAWLKPWRGAMAFFSLFGHEARLKALETASATKADVQALASDLEDHDKRDVSAFQKVNDEMAHIRDNMAQKSDLARVESNLTSILIDGFNRAGRRT